MSRHRINSPKVIHQTFETEVVVVNLETGSYYSVEGAGIDIWHWLEACRRDDEIVAAFENGASQRARNFLRELADEQLIVPNEDAKAPADSEVAATRNHSLGEPRLRKFTDMRDLLLLDPIHELDEHGWPQRGQPQAQK